MPPVLDELDRRILALLQEDARRSAEAIGAGIGLSASRFSAGSRVCVRRP